MKQGGIVRWSRYSGMRIYKDGWRTSVELPASQPFGPTTRRYGCVWEEPNGFHGYYEVEGAGELEDIEVGPFQSESEARRTVEQLLKQTYPNSLK